MLVQKVEGITPKGRSKNENSYIWNIKIKNNRNIRQGNLQQAKSLRSDQIQAEKAQKQGGLNRYKAVKTGDQNSLDLAKIELEKHYQRVMQTNMMKCEGTEFDYFISEKYKEAKDKQNQY